MKTLAIISGGMDSATLAYFLKARGDDLTLLSFDYGQRHKIELSAARLIAEYLSVPHILIDIQSIGKQLTGSALTDSIEVPDGHYAEESMRITVVPNRNAIMLSIAFGVAYARKLDAVAIGNHAGDHFIYPDCRPEFIRTFQDMQDAAGGEMWSVELTSPFVDITKSDIVKIGHSLHVPYKDTWSCYKGVTPGALPVHCGTCGTCTERKEAFQLAGVPDPTDYIR